MKLAEMRRCIWCTKCKQHPKQKAAKLGGLSICSDLLATEKGS
jgi:hypothetical protein